MSRAKYGSNIPQARSDLHAVANMIDTLIHNDGVILRSEGMKLSFEIRRIIEAHMHQYRPDKITRMKIPPPTEAQREQVLHLRRTTSLSQLEIANRVGLNPGRVSEIIHKDRGS